jgi:hypothetical protein
LWRGCPRRFCDDYDDGRKAMNVTATPDERLLYITV